MLQFSEEYFKTEERAGYLVGEAIKRVWAAELEVLHKIIEICQRHDLQYYIFWGSLLGAVRHHGFIPWDDDIDIAMLGEDYEAFLEYAKYELPKEYHVLNPYTDNALDIHFTRVTNSKEIDLVGSWSKEYHGCPFAMGIDIFPLYYIPRDKNVAEEQKRIMTFVKQLKDIMCYRNQHQELSEKEKNEYDMVIAQSLVDVQKMTGYQFTSNRPIPRQLDVVFDLMSRIATREESDCVASFDEYIVNNRRIYPITYFEEPIQLPFENIMVTAPREYDKILRDVYKDYMTPRNYNKLETHAAVKAQMQRLGNYLEGSYFQNKNGGNGIKIQIEDIPKGKITYEQAKEKMPSEWLKKIYVEGPNGERIQKTVLLYCMTVDSFLFSSAYVIEKIKRTLSILSKQSDVVIWWFSSISLDDMAYTLKEFVPETLTAYKRLVEEYISNDVGIYDESGDILRAITMSDAYYGDEGILMPVYTKIGKPVMIQDYAI